MGEYSITVVVPHSTVDRENATLDENRDLPPDNSHWWFASFISPILGATFGPIATAFSICAMLRPCLIAVNIIQLCLAIFSYLNIFLGLLGKIRYKIAQLSGIVGYYASSFCLSYYYALYASGIYFLLASLMLVNFLGALLLRLKPDITQSTALLSLLLCSVCFLTFVFLGALVFSHIEGWQYQDSVYWADVTLLTIGFGDIAPETPLGRALLFPYAILGITCLGITLASIRRLVLDRGELALRRRRLGKMRDELLKRSPQRAISLCDRERLTLVFAATRAIQSKASRRWRWTMLAMSVGAWLLLLFGGAAVFLRCEKEYQGWSYFNALYMAFVSLTTIGYGDLAPTSSCGRSFFVLWSLLGVPTITIVISNLETPLLRITYYMRRRIEGIKMSRLRGTFSKITKPISSQDFRMNERLTDAHQQTSSGANQERTISGTREQYCIVVLDALLGIVRHVHDQPLEHYSVNDWLWFGKLLGGWTIGHEAPGDRIKREQETRSNSRMNDVVVPEFCDHREESLPSLATVKLGQVTAESPLMGPKEEAEWFLERLAAVLRQELVAMTRDRVQESDISSRLRSETNITE
ncbi:hypothetical protein GE09DRAFT_225496 [Coniochaeta sp. 2T2.1]|nr:hypothetical protein GE09DRAFT_225496 [Coniochaeta sp. 2T2.1]